MHSNGKCGSKQSIPNAEQLSTRKSGEQRAKGEELSASKVFSSLSALSPSLLAFDACELAQIRRGDGLGAAPHKKEQCFAAPPAGWMADHVAGAFCRGERGLAGAIPDCSPVASMILWCTKECREPLLADRRARFGAPRQRGRRLLQFAATSRLAVEKVDGRVR